MWTVRLRSSAATIAFLFWYPLGITSAQIVGERCNPGDTSQITGVRCQRSNDFEFQEAHIQNAKKGDIVVTASCGMIGGLLRQVSPPQRFSHSGMMVSNRYYIRHSTATEDRYKDHAGSDGFGSTVLKYGWPGTITERIGEAFEGKQRYDPDGKSYFVKSFNKDPAQCPEDAAVTFPMIVKPPIDAEVAVRSTLETIADHAKELHGHYRFFAYSDATIAGNPRYSAVPESGWAHFDAIDGTVCSQAIWTAARLAGVPVEDSIVEPGDRLGRPLLPSQLGLSIYTEAERRVAAEWLHASISNAIYEESGWLGEALTDASSDGANQITNCFAFDWCGNELGSDAKDSDQWRNPGIGIAVSPDDLTNWDEPPGGVYGRSEPMEYRPGVYTPIYKWQDDAYRCRELAEDIAKLDEQIRSFMNSSRRIPNMPAIVRRIQELQAQMRAKRSAHTGCEQPSSPISNVTDNAPPNPNTCDELRRQIREKENRVNALSSLVARGQKSFMAELHQRSRELTALKRRVPAVCP